MPKSIQSIPLNVTKKDYAAPISRVTAWSVWLIASIFFAYQYILKIMPNIMMDDIMQQFHIDAALFGQFSGIYYIGYALMHVPIGLMLDRYGPRIVMTVSILLTVIGLLPIVFADHWIYSLLGRALIGMGSAAAILGTFKVIHIAFCATKFTRMLSFSITIGFIGALYGGGPMGYMCSTLGYKVVVQIFAGLGLILAGLTYFTIPNMVIIKRGRVFAEIKEVLTNHKVLALCFFAGLMAGPLEGFADAWGSEFLKQVYGFNTSIANYLTSMIFIGMCFGAPILSVIAQRTGNYLSVIAGAGMLMLIAFIALVTGSLTVNSVIISFIIVGALCAYQILVIYKATTYVPAHCAGLTTAVANMIIMSFGYAFHSIIGFVVNTFGGTGAAQSYIYGIAVIPVTLSIGVLGFSILAYQEMNDRRIKV